MFQQVKDHVRYWGFLLLKCIAAALGATLALAFLNLGWPPATPWFHLNEYQFCQDLTYTALAGVWFLFSYGLFYLAFWDQRYRCRTCLRRLRMPVETGSYGYMLQLGRPRIEYICPYGHGSLNIEEIQFPGKVPPEWTERGDIWSELFASKHAASQRDDDE
jgi:hypothetical protein